MTDIAPDRVNDPASSPAGRSNGGLLSGLQNLGELQGLIPYALAFLADDGEGYASLKRDLRTWAKDDPIDALLATVIGGGLAFYAAERETNPACKNPWDGILYMATALSGGFDKLVPTTTTGHALATFVHGFGPSLAHSALEPPAAEQREVKAQAAAVNLAILERLDTIVKLLEAKQ